MTNEAKPTWEEIKGICEECEEELALWSEGIPDPQEEGHVKSDARDFYDTDVRAATLARYIIAQHEKYEGMEKYWALRKEGTKGKFLPSMIGRQPPVLHVLARSKKELESCYYPSDYEPVRVSIIVEEK